MTVRRRLPLSATSTTAIVFGSLSLWLLWPLLRPPLARTRGPLLLLSCPVMGRLTPRQWRRAGGRPVFIDRSGPDSARQLTALDAWLDRPPPGLPAFSRVLLVSDSNHIPRLLPAARLVLGGRGLTVDALLTDGDRPPARRFPHPGPWPIVRDWLRLQLWRATGSTGAFLVPSIQRRKSLVCVGL